jgi:hypothetical protein
MTLDDIKQAAKRLRKHIPELAPAAGNSLTHTQALDLVARLHGFRHYREAQQRLGDHQEAAPAPVAGAKTRLKAREVLADDGGITLAGGLHFDISRVRISAREPLTIEGPSGCGKSLLTKELVCQALAQGMPVRILDTTGEYRHFTLALGGQYFYGVDLEDFQETWASPAPLVVVSVSPAWPESFSFEQLRGMPKEALFFCEDTGALSYEHLEVPTIRIRHRHPLMAGAAFTGFRSKPDSRAQWLLQLSNAQEPVTATYRFSSARDAAF